MTLTCIVKDNHSFVAEIALLFDSDDQRLISSCISMSHARPLQDGVADADMLFAVHKQQPKHLGWQDFCFVYQQQQQYSIGKQEVEGLLQKDDSYSIVKPSYLPPL